MVRSSRSSRRTIFSLLAFLSAMAFGPPIVRPQTPEGPAGIGGQPQEVDFSYVTIDGQRLFAVRGIRGMPSSRRAGQVAARIREAARDAAVTKDDVRVEPTELGLQVVAGTHPIVVVFDVDAALEGTSVETLSRVYARIVGNAIVEWRVARAKGKLLRGLAYAVGGALVLIGLLLLLRRLWRVFSRFLDHRVAARIKDINVQSTKVIRAERIRAVVAGLTRGLFGLTALSLIFIYLQTTLAAFPWTRGTSASLLQWVVDPLLFLGSGIVEAIPGLLFIAVAWIVTRFILRGIRAIFSAIESGATTLGGFEPEWAQPTYRLVRLAVIVLFLVMIYPYIPGSSSGAFKGMSLFLGVVFSLGSSSIIGNLVAGYGMTYRRAFKVGDRIRVDGSVGLVEERRLLVTHLRSPKNEEIIVPNTVILNGTVINYSSLARREGLILHTTVGIGYETPWRQVEAMLIEAARRTPGLEPDPPPFVLQQQLGDFCITYEINAYTRDASRMPATYSALHANILDVFNEYGIQIMTPAYEGDPEVPKIVDRKDWYAAPAASASPEVTPQES